MIAVAVIIAMRGALGFRRGQIRGGYGAPAETWMGVQAAYDLWQAKQRGTIKVERYPTPEALALG